MTNPSDYGTKELSNRHDLKVEETMKAGVFRVRRVDSSVLEGYLVRNRLDDSREVSKAMFDAGNRLATDWHMMGAEPSVIAPYKEMIPGSGLSFAEAREDARRRFREAVSKISSENKNATLSVVCYDEKATRRRMPQLRAGLKELVIYYGY